MQEIKELFKSIDRDDCDESMQEMVSDDIIDSVDVMALVAAIEKKYQKKLAPKFIVAENYESFDAIKKMLKEAMS